MSSQAPPEAPAGLSTPLERPPAVSTSLVAMAAYAALFAIGGALAVIGAFLLPLSVGGLRLPVSVAVAAAGNLAIGLLGGRGTGTRLGAALPGLCWLGVVLLLGRQTSEGDLVVVGDAVSLGFLLAGALGSAVAVALCGGEPVAAEPPGGSGATRLEERP